MNSIVSTITSIAQFSEDGTKRYLLQKGWDSTKPSLAVIMMCPSSASAISMDSTTMLTQNNSERLGYGSVAILNLFATLNDFDLKEAEDTDAENLEVISECCRNADAIIFCPGVGKNRNKTFLERQRQVLEVLRPMENKLYCLCDANGKSRLQHPLTPALRTWHLSPLLVSELIPTAQKPSTAKKETVSQPTEKKRRGRPSKETDTTTQV